MLTIRELRSNDDLSAVLSLCRDFFAEYEIHHKEFFDLDHLTDDDISARFIDSITSEDSATLMALVDNKIVGYALLVIRDQPRFYKIKKIGAISGLMVDKNYRRRGIATKLLDKSKSFFRNRGINYYTLYTAVANQEAAEFYDKNGLTKLHYSYLGES